MNVPSNLRYTSHDEWILVEGDEITVGITDYAQDALGELVHVELPEEGADVSAGDSIAEVESVKAVAEVYAPVSGEITAINEDLEDEAEKINEDAFGSWLFKMKISDASELDGLMDAEAYKAKISA